MAGVDQDDGKEKATAEDLEQGYVICPCEKRFHFLLTFLKKNRSKKVMVLYSTSMMVKFHHEILEYMDLPVMSIHDKQEQIETKTTFVNFRQSTSGILLCTEVAARKLGAPNVDWIVQYDPTDNPKKYIRRARVKGNRGYTLLVLQPDELKFLSYLKKAHIPVVEFNFSWNKISNIQLQLEKLISQNYFLNKSAKQAYKSYVQAYDSHRFKSIFNIENLDITKAAKSFGLKVPPAVDLGVERTKNQMKNQEKRL